jgi:hypothetical protein
LTALTAATIPTPTLLPRRVLRAQEARVKGSWSDHLVVPMCVALPSIPPLFVELLNKAVGTPYEGSVTALIAHSLWVSVAKTPPPTAIIMMVILTVCATCLVVYFYQAVTFRPFNDYTPAPIPHPELAVPSLAYRELVGYPW